MRTLGACLGAQGLQHADHRVRVLDVRQVFQQALIGRKQGSGQYGQGRVLGSCHNDLTAQPVATLDYETHRIILRLARSAADCWNACVLSTVQYIANDWACQRNSTDWPYLGTALSRS